MNIHRNSKNPDPKRFLKSTIYGIQLKISEHEKKQENVTHMKRQINQIYPKLTQMLELADEDIDSY